MLFVEAKALLFKARLRPRLGLHSSRSAPWRRFTANCHTLCTDDSERGAIKTSCRDRPRSSDEDGNVDVDLDNGKNCPL